MKQSDIFLAGEGDQWFRRNQNLDLHKDPLLHVLQGIVGPGSLLEVGCSDGARLRELSNIEGLSVCGVEPSKEAVRAAKNGGLDVRLGTSDTLNFEPDSFDWVLFGFCLYLCDREDLFQIASEADRVLKDDGRIVIYDFDPGVPCANKYHHIDGVESFKMDYSAMFLWNPVYSLEKKDCFFHGGGKGLHEDRNERLSISVLRRKKNGAYPSCDAL